MKVGRIEQLSNGEKPGVSYGDMTPSTSEVPDFQLVGTDHLHRLQERIRELETENADLRARLDAIHERATKALERFP